MKCNLKNLDFVWFNGEFKKTDEAVVSVLNHSLHYGGAAFEGIRAYNGKIFKIKEHFLRLFHSANTLGIKIQYSLEELCDIAYKTLEKNNLEDAYIRPFVFKSTDTLKINVKNFETSVIIAAWELKKYFQCDKKKGISIGFSKFKKPSFSDFLPWSSKISGLYALNQISKNNCDESFDDVLVFDDRGFLTELTTSNIFLVKNNVLLTPIADCFLNGITRQTVIQIANENQIECRECRLTKDDLLDADEVFATGTAVEIVPIVAINNLKFFNENELMMTNMMQELYKKKTII